MWSKGANLFPLAANTKVMEMSKGVSLHFASVGTEIPFARLMLNTFVSESNGVEKWILKYKYRLWLLCVDW